MTPPRQGQDDRDRSAPDIHATAIAAFAIAESLALALAERGTLDQKEVESLLQDAAAAQRNAAQVSGASEHYAEAARLIGRVISGVRCVDRPR